MTRLVDVVSRALDPAERDAVLGDLTEAGETGGRALVDVIGLIFRRQAMLWKNWRPWLALAGVALPLGLMLAVISRRIADRSAVYAWLYLNNWTGTYITNAAARAELIQHAANIFANFLLLACCSWLAGFLLESVARRTIWISGALLSLVLLIRSIAPSNHPGLHDAVFSLTFYSAMLPLIVQAVLVLFPSLWGMHHSRRTTT